MYENIFYNNGKAYKILRKIKEHNLDPRPYGGKDNHQNRMKILMCWRDELNADHLMKVGDRFLLCQIIEDAKII